MFDTLKAKWHEFEATYLTPSQPQPLIYKAIITDTTLTGECNGKIFGQINWQDIEQIAINIEGDFEPYPYWYIGHATQGVRLPNDTENMGDVLTALEQHLPGFATTETQRLITIALQAAEGRYQIWQR